MHKTIKFLLWSYVVLLLFEGALRKWVFPGMADALLIVRDPVVLAIYVMAIVDRVFPVNGFIIAAGVLAAASVAATFLTGQHNMVVMLYGLRIDFLHLPLIWVMAAVMDQRDVQRHGTFLLLMAIPMALIMVDQFRSPMNAPINRGVGGTDIGQIFGADGRIRPPGLFAFITGPQVFLPFAAAFFFHQSATQRRLPWIILMAAGGAIVISLPVSISRTAMVATLFVGVTFAGTLLFSSKRAGAILRAGLIGSVLLVSLSFLPIFRESRDVFMMRWTSAASSEGSALDTVSDRMFGGIFGPFRAMGHAKLFGAGIGVGSNVGARLLSGSVGFLLAEDEWSKIVLELGPVLGGAFLIFRTVLTIHLGWLALMALIQKRDPLPILLFSAVGYAVFQYQWGPPTLLGFAVFGSGLLLASLKPAAADEPAAAPMFVPEAFPAVPAFPPATAHRPPVALKFPQS